ncbi:MAG: 6-phosphofructokinase, partial [Rhodospirillales bacterium]|nr:6-phosphofructokinase [Rhodospirillales bacterium]
VLIPEVNFPLDGEDGLLAHLDKRLQRRGHAVIVVAEGAGQQYCEAEGADKSGNKKLGDIGPFLKERITAHMKGQGKEVNIKYIDPSYVIRGIAATPHDSVYCFRLAGHAVHAAMAGRTEMLVGKWHGTFVHLPIPLAVAKRQCVDQYGDLWMSVMEATGQPRWSAE